MKLIFLLGTEFVQNSKRYPNFTNEQKIWKIIHDLKEQTDTLDITFLLITNKKDSANFLNNDSYESLVYFIDEKELYEEIYK